MDILEAGGDLLGISSRPASLLAGALREALKSGRSITLVSHSQGFATTIQAMRLLALKGTDASGLTVYPHAGAGNSFHAASVANSIGATLMPHVFSSYDLVPGLVGMNANPLQALAGMVGMPKLFSNKPGVSPHTEPDWSPNLRWITWGPGN